MADKNLSSKADVRLHFKTNSISPNWLSIAQLMEDSIGA